MIIEVYCIACLGNKAWNFAAERMECGHGRNAVKEGDRQELDKFETNRKSWQEADRACGREAGCQRKPGHLGDCYVQLDEDVPMDSQGREIRDASDDVPARRQS